ncbi:MFS transporter [Vulcanisaeta distributa]|uniref:Major facilitator superfamily MFS_1 n=1 Tax=Vulcanisaeta distributa (strain DSM 14429 / JCM 11212 / NBRC 100878 / IC-017) TaxID=572478 RepID=E1QTV8_VULDI|nr:MFS transporter [Vulcanisaeta distributa]ADN51025.1 major facilitator superfamily MFS_1 [Vulcanisaeta distributa DSM 14429]
MDKTQFIVLVLLTLATFMTALDSTIVVLALPVMLTALHTDLSILVWVILIYILTVTIFSTQLGKLGDLKGRAKMFNFGMILFGIGSALCGLSTSAIELIGFRTIQALGGSLMTSNTMAIASDYFRPEERGFVFGTTSMGWNLGAVAGILAGGIITTFIGWRWIFYINVPIAIFSFITGLAYLKDRGVRVKQDFDIYGAITLGLSLGLLSMAGITYAGVGYNNVVGLMILLGLALFAIFIYIETRAKSPLISLRLFRIKMFTLSSFSYFFQYMANNAILFLLIMYLQGVRGLNPFYASIWLVPGYLLGSIAATFGGRLADRSDARVIASIGLMLQAVAYVLYDTLLTLTTPFYYITIIASISGVGAGMFFAANGKMVMLDVPRDMYGIASGTNRTIGNIGILLSFIIAIVVSSMAIPRSVAFQIFVGTSVLTPSLMAPFINSLHMAFRASLALVAVAIATSWSRTRVPMTQQRRIVDRP